TNYSSRIQRFVTTWGRMTSFRSILIVMAPAATLSLGAVMPAYAAARERGDCLTDQQFRAAISSGQIKSWDQIRRLANIPSDYYETSDVQVCRQGGTLYYSVNMVSPKGENFTLVLNAVDGTA